jgi:hypothetical protein
VDVDVLGNLVVVDCRVHFVSVAVEVCKNENKNKNTRDARVKMVSIRGHDIDGCLCNLDPGPRRNQIQGKERDQKVDDHRPVGTVSVGHLGSIRQRCKHLISQSTARSLRRRRLVIYVIYTTSPMRASLRLHALPRTVRAVLSDAATAPSAANGDAAEQQATVHGWVRSVRAHKNVAFAEIDDGSGAALQAVFRGPRDDG